MSTVTTIIEMPKRTRRRRPVDPAAVDLLEETATMARMIRTYQDEIIRLGKARRANVLGLREHRVTYRVIAEAIGSSEQNVYKIIRGDL